MMQSELRVLILGLILAAPLTAQQQADTALAARLERAEHQIELLREQLGAAAPRFIAHGGGGARTGR